MRAQQRSCGSPRTSNGDECMLHCTGLIWCSVLAYACRQTPSSQTTSLTSRSSSPARGHRQWAWPRCEWSSALGTRARLFSQPLPLQDISSSIPAAKQLFEQASSILGYDLLQTCIEGECLLVYLCESRATGLTCLGAGPKDRLDSTVVSQPAIYVASLAALEKLRQDEGEVRTSGWLCCRAVLGAGLKPHCGRRRCRLQTWRAG